jgi:hypothetical protein
VSIDVPVLVVTWPQELGAVGPDFDVIADVHVSNTTLFRALFRNEFICLSLDGNPSACWPMAQVSVTCVGH